MFREEIQPPLQRARIEVLGGPYRRSVLTLREDRPWVPRADLSSGLAVHGGGWTQ